MMGRATKKKRASLVENSLAKCMAELEAHHNLITHDFANFSTTILGIIDYLLYQEESPLSAKQMELLRRARRQCYEMHRLAESARVLGRIRNRAAITSNAPTQVHAAIAHAVETVRALHFDRPFILHEECPEDFTLHGFTYLDEVLVNLLDNALRYSAEAGLPSIGLKAFRRDDHVTIEVVGGEPPEPEIMSQIFERRMRGPHSRGSGIGLSVIRKVIESVGGQISANVTNVSGHDLVVVTIQAPLGEEESCCAGGDKCLTS